jgi:2-hydroxychromene-2-carboxylate isomerase
MAWAKEQGQDVLRAYTRGVYAPFWRRELDIESPAEIERVLRESGAAVGGFRAWAEGEGRSRHEAEQRAVVDAGIFGVPAFVVGGEWYWGREHLPRVRWLLGGKRGSAPDVAYEGSASALEVLTGAAGAARLEVAIDFKSPLAYLALEPTLALADELGIELDWQPLVVPPLRRHPEPTPGDDRGARHRRTRAEYFRRDPLRYAQARGLSLAAAERAADSTTAALGLAWVKREAPARARAYVERVFAAHWRESLELSDPAAIERLLGEVGAPTAGFASYLKADGPAELAVLRNALLAANVFDVPSYRLGDEVFLGRQHLPVIRDLLAAR